MGAQRIGKYKRGVQQVTRSTQKKKKRRVFGKKIISKTGIEKKVRSDSVKKLLKSSTESSKNKKTRK